MKPQTKYGETSLLTPSDIQTGVGTSGKDDELGKVLAVLYAPTLTLIRYYLHAKNGNKKTPQNCVQEFSEKHPDAFMTAFGIDLFWRIVGIVLVLFVFARGLGIFKI